MAEVVLNGVTKSFGDLAAVDDLSLTVPDGGFVVLLGPTGAGKTTTLRLVAGLERPDHGSVWIAGRDVTTVAPAERDITFVFQQYSLYPHLSVFDNLAFPLRSPARRLPKDQIRERVQEIAAVLRIDHKLQNRATKLSGGEMQRVAIGRALVRRPAIYLMDEPLSSLDAKLRAELRLELKRVQRDLGATILYVTHDQIEALTLATEVGVLDEGRLVQLGTPRQIYEDPASSYVASRLGTPRINLLPVEVAKLEQVPAGAVTVGVRTEHVGLVPRPNGQGRAVAVQRIEHLGDQSHVHLRLDGHEMVVLVDPHAPVEAGSSLAIEFRNPLFFDRDGQRIRTHV